MTKSFDDVKRELESFKTEKNKELNAAVLVAETSVGNEISCYNLCSVIFQKFIIQKV